MIVIGVDAHMETHTAAVIDGQTARQMDELTVPARDRAYGELVDWARGFEADRVWAIPGNHGLRTPQNPARLTGALVWG
jgi:transposase